MEGSLARVLTEHIDNGLYRRQGQHFSAEGVSRRRPLSSVWRPTLAMLRINLTILIEKCSVTPRSVFGAG